VTSSLARAGALLMRMRAAAPLLLSRSTADGQGDRTGGSITQACAAC